MVKHTARLAASIATEYDPLPEDFVLPWSNYESYESFWTDVNSRGSRVKDNEKEMVHDYYAYLMDLVDEGRFKKFRKQLKDTLGEDFPIRAGAAIEGRIHKKVYIPLAAASVAELLEDEP